jgi:FkbM family methyltransferase
MLTRRQYVETLQADVEFFARELPSGSLCFDIGANIGEKSEALLKAGMSVIAVEPQPLCVEEIRARCRRYGNIKIKQTAVGSTVGEAELFLSDIFHASSSLDKDWTPSHKSIKVPLTTLDLLIEEFGLPSFCKIDVEGYELSVLKGLTQKIPLISLEYHLMERDLQKTFDCLEYLADLSNQDIRINLSPAEHFGFNFPEWLSFDDFKAIFPDEFRGREGFYYGDIWIKSY